jgi:hypothetical protein
MRVVSTDQPAVGVGSDGDGSPRVFVSYAHDSAEHKELVRRFATFLREEAGVDVHMDLWYDGERRDWSVWAIDQLTRADFIVVIASPAYKRRADGLAPADEGRGAQFEAAIIRNNLTRNLPKETRRVLPVVLPGRSIEEIPTFLNAHSTTRYTVAEYTLEDPGIKSLLVAFTGVPQYRMPTRGPYIGSPSTNEHGASHPFDEPSPDGDWNRKDGLPRHEIKFETNVDGQATVGQIVNIGTQTVHVHGQGAVGVPSRRVSPAPGVPDLPHRAGTRPIPNAAKRFVVVSAAGVYRNPGDPDESRLVTKYRNDTVELHLDETDATGPDGRLYRAVRTPTRGISGYSWMLADDLADTAARPDQPAVARTVVVVSAAGVFRNPGDPDESRLRSRYRNDTVELHLDAPDVTGPNGRVYRAVRTPTRGAPGYSWMLADELADLSDGVAHTEGDDPERD